MNLVYLAKLHSEDRVQSDCYLTLAEEKILELVELAKTRMKLRARQRRMRPAKFCTPPPEITEDHARV
jgi:hypothetical protein